MKRRLPAGFRVWGGFFLLLMMVSAMAPFAGAQSRDPKPLSFDEPYSDGPVFFVPIEGMIDNGLARYIDRALSDAAADDAALVLFEVDTFGGLVDAADQIRQTLLDAPMPTVAFIDKNAASAGALISYAADRIIMVPGASIGAATVVEGTSGEAAPDKYQSYMRGLMRATAEANGRDPSIAEAMVDETLFVEGVSEEGKVLTLSSKEALSFGVADEILETVDEAVDALGLTEATIVAHEASKAEQVLRFFGSPIVQSILMLMMLGGLYFELQTPGVGFAGAVALFGAALFFAPHYLLGLVESWEIILFVLGVALILAEIFVIPGFGIAGISGIIMVVVSLLVSLVGNIGFSFPPLSAFSPAFTTLAATFVLLVLLMFSLGRYLPKSQRFNQLVLAPELSSATGYTAAETHRELVGQIGRTLTPLRPSGMMEIGHERVDVITSGEFMASGMPVKVVRVQGSRVEVRGVKVLPAEDETSPV
ncbi:MAG: nodulation protein NfeD [Rhodothermales bacterium]